MAWLGLDQRGVKVIGEIPAKLPPLQWPAIDGARMSEFGTSALAIAVLGLLEAISMAKSIAAQTRQKLDLNQQCLSEGLANFAGSFFQCIPGSGSLTRSAINQQAGAVTQWSGVVSAIAVALVMLVFAPYARFVPRAALAGILMLTAWRMIDRHALAYHIRATRFDAVIVAATAISAVAISIEFCVLIGVFMSFLLTVPRAGRMLLTEFVVSPEGSVHDRLPEDEVCGRILIFGLEGELFFGATAALETHLATIEERVVAADTSVIVMRMKRLHNADAVGLALIDGFVERIPLRGVRVVLCGVRKGLFETMKKTGLVARVGETDIFLSNRCGRPARCSRFATRTSHHPEPCPTCPRRDRETRDRNLHYEVSPGHS